MPLQYKFVEVEGQRYIPVNDKGLPIVVDDAKDEELAIDGIGSYLQIPKLREEAKQYRLQKEEAEKVSKVLTENEIDIENLTDWLTESRQARETVANLKTGDLKKAEEVEQIKKAAKEDLEKQKKILLDEKNREVDELKGDIAELEGLVNHLMIDQKLLSSKFLNSNFAVSAEVILPHVKGNFRVEKGDDGKRRTIAYHNDGSPILDPSNYGPADVEIALTKLTESSELLRSLLKGSSASGSGAGGAAQMTKGGRTIKSNPFKKESWNVTEQNRIYAEDPALFERLKSEAGR